MQGFYKIKAKIGKRILNNLLKRSSKRKVKSCNINEANSLGLLCMVNEEDDYKKVLKLVKFLKDEYGIINIKALAFYPKKNDHHFLQSRLGFDYYKIQDLNWFCLPNNITVRNFINESFDILLDITDKEIIPQRFVLHYSKASLKVGTYSAYNQKYLDLMIDVKANDFEKYINQVVTYLDMLNKPVH